jgi:hypothetical protein
MIFPCLRFICCFEKQGSDQEGNSKNRRCKFAATNAPYCVFLIFVTHTYTNFSRQIIKNRAMKIGIMRSWERRTHPALLFKIFSFFRDYSKQMDFVCVLLVEKSFFVS